MSQTASLALKTSDITFGATTSVGTADSKKHHLHGLLSTYVYY